MSEMFTKCNGFIVSGDPLVYADSATMTGQGTVSEPFGVKSTDLYVQEPLYTGTSGSSAYIGWRPDETVLWSGTCLTQGAAAVSLSEPASDFEKIEIYAVPNPSDTYNVAPQIFTYPGSNTSGAYMCPFMTDGLKGKFSVGLWTITNGSSFNLIAAGQTDAYPTVGWNNVYGGVVRVVGINRKV